MKYKSSISILSFQILTTVFQLAYAGFTSRMGTPLEFGYYASALAAQGFLTLVFSSTFTADVVRASTVDEQVTRRLFSRALLTSVLAFICALALGFTLTGITHIPFGVFLATAALAGLTPIQLFLWGVYSQRKMLTRASFLGFFGSVTGFYLEQYVFGLHLLPPAF